MRTPLSAVSFDHLISFLVVDPPWSSHGVRRVVMQEQCDEAVCDISTFLTSCEPVLYRVETWITAISAGKLRQTKSSKNVQPDNQATTMGNRRLNSRKIAATTSGVVNWKTGSSKIWHCGSGSSKVKLSADCTKHLEKYCSRADQCVREKKKTFRDSSILKMNHRTWPVTRICANYSPNSRNSEKRFEVFTDFYCILFTQLAQEKIMCQKKKKKKT